MKVKLKRTLSVLLCAVLLAGAAGLSPSAAAAANAEPPEEINVSDYVESIAYLDERHPYVEMNRKRKFVDWYFPTTFLFTFKDGSAQTVTVDTKATAYEVIVITEEFEVTMPDGVVLNFDQMILYEYGTCQWYLRQCFHTPGDPHQLIVLDQKCEGSWPPAPLRERLQEFWRELVWKLETVFYKIRYYLSSLK